MTLKEQCPFLQVLRYISGIGGSSTENISRKDVKFTITTMIKGFEALND